MASTFVICCEPAGGARAAGRCTGPRRGSPIPSTPEDGPVVVLHVLSYHEGRVSEDMEHLPGPGRPGSPCPTGSASGAWFDVEGTVVGDGRGWDQVRFNVFPSRAAFLAVALDPDRIAAQADHREPAIADTYTVLLRAPPDRQPDAPESRVTTRDPSNRGAAVKQTAAIRCVRPISRCTTSGRSRRSPRRVPRRSTEPGTLYYDWFLDEDSGRARLVEGYDSYELIVAHATGPVFTEIGPRLLDACTFVHMDAYGDTARWRRPQFWPSTYWGPAIAGLTDDGPAGLGRRPIRRSGPARPWPAGDGGPRRGRRRTVGCAGRRTFGPAGSRPTRPRRRGPGWPGRRPAAPCSAPPP